MRLYIVKPFFSEFDLFIFRILRFDILSQRIKICILLIEILICRDITRFTLGDKLIF